MIGQLELNLTLSLSLDDHRSGQDLIAMHDIANPKTYQVAAAKLAVDGEIE